MRLPACLTVLLLAVCAAPAAATPGEIDPTFGGDGEVVVEPCTKPSYLTGPIATAPDGGIFVSASCTSGPGGIPEDAVVLRLLPGGAVDPGFGEAGRVALGLGRVTDLVAHPDGGLYVLGSSGEGFQGAVRRLAPNGSLIAQRQLGGTFARRSFEAGALTPSGGLAVAGAFRLQPDADLNTYVGVFTPALELDGSFSGDGQRTFGVQSGQDDEASGIGVDAEGRIVVSGVNRKLNATDVHVARLLPDGGFDSSFAGDGLTTIDRAQFDRSESFAVRPDGRVLVGLTQGAILSLLPDGSPEASFGTAGVVTVPPEDAADFGLDAAGRIVGGGQQPIFRRGTTDPVDTYRILPSGVFDPAWGLDGRSTVFFDPAPNTTDSVVDAAGRLVVLGETFADGTNPPVARMLRVQGDPPPAPPAVVEQNPAPPAVVPPAPKPPVPPAADTRKPRFTHSLLRSKRRQLARNRRFGARILADEDGLWTLAVTAETQVKVGRRFKRVPGTATRVLKRTTPIAVKAGVRATRTVKLSPKTLAKVLARTHLRFRYTLTDAAGNTRTATFTHRLRTITRTAR